MNKQKGFTLVEGLLIAIVLGIVGFGGYHVWNQNVDDETEVTETSHNKVDSSQQEDNIVTKADSDSVPAGFVEYSNSELNIMFAYPESWGEVVAELGSETDHLIKGNEYLLSFSDNENISAGLKSNDWEHDPLLGHGGGTGALYYSDRLDNGVDYQSILYHVDNKQTKLFSEPYGAYECEGAATVLVQRILGNDQYDTITFFHIDETRPVGDPSDLVCEEYKDHISNEVVSSMEALSSTIKNL